MTKQQQFILATSVLWASVVSPANADVFNNVATGLAYAGFDVIGNQNPLSGGGDLLVTNTFNGESFDFGAWDLSFQGPVSMQVSTGGRYLSQFDISLSTAVNGRSEASPLDYDLNYNVGGQSTKVSGSALLDAKFALNGFGFYKLTVDYSSRQTVERNGDVVTDEADFDSDFGPMTISGNLFTDALALLTDPFFERSGRENPFTSLSKAAQLIEADPLQRQSLLKALAAPNNDFGVAAAFGPSGGLGNGHSPPGLANASQHGRGGPNTLVVPEPPVVALLLLGIPAVVCRWSYRHRVQSHSSPG